MIDFHLVVIMIEVFKEALTGKYIPQRSCEEENKQSELNILHTFGI